MAGRRAPSRRAVVQAQTPKVGDGQTQRALDVVHQAILDLQARRHLEQFTSSEPGYVPESGGAEFDFLAADGTWKTVVGAGSVDSVTAGSTMVSVTPTTGNVVVDVVPANFTGILMSGITFSGTNNRLAKFSAATLADSTITDTGVLVTVANAMTVTGAGVFSSTLSATGNFAVNTSMFTVAASTGNTLAAGTLDVTGNFRVNTSKFTVAASTGNTLVAGTLDATGDFKVNTSKFTVAASTGNTVVAGTFNSQGAGDFDTTLNVDGATTLRSTVTLTTMTQGSVFFAGVGGLVSQNNSNLFWDDSNAALGVGTLSTVNTYRMVVKAVPGPATNGICVKIIGDSTGSYSAVDFWDSAGVRQGAVGYGGSATLSGFASVNYLYTTGPDWAFVNATTTERAVVVGPTSGAVYAQMMNGASAAVSAASTGRLRYSSSSQVFQTSHNGGSYFNVPQLAAALTTGSVAFADSNGRLAQDNSNFYWDDSNNRLGIGTAATPAISLHVKASVSGESALRLETSSTSGYSALTLFNSSAAQQGTVGYGNSAVGVTHLRLQNFLHTTGVDWVVADSTAIALTFHPVSGSAGQSFANGSSLAVSASSQGRIRYNTTGQKFQISVNAGAYVDAVISSSAAVGVANTIPKWTAANAQGISLLTDDGTTFAINVNKFTVTEASGNTLVAGTLDATGDFKVNTNKFTVTASSGNTLVAGTLSVTSDFAVNTSKFTVAASTGNTVVAGTLSVTGDFAVATSKFTVAASSGNTVAAGSFRAPNIGINTAPSAILLDTRASADVCHALFYASGGNGVYATAVDQFEVRNDDQTSVYNLMKLDVANVTAKTLLFTSAGRLFVGGELELDGAFNHDGTTVGFYGTAPATQQTITGSRGGNAALASLLTKLATLGLIVDSTSA